MKHEEIQWDIGRAGRSWRKEAMARWELTPEKIEMVDGKLFNDDEERLTMVAMLLENVGIDRVIRLGDPANWRAAINEL